MERWLPVVEYAVNKRVSISTLRRRIKMQMLDHRLENGRYLIRAELENEHLSPEVDFQATEQATKLTQELIMELKRAYGMVLAEKEEVIKQLKSEIETLKHINKFLEFQILNNGPRSENGFDEPSTFD